MYNLLKKIWHEYLPQWAKTPIIFIVNGSGRLKGKIYIAAANGRIWFPDKAFQAWDYKIHSGRKLNMKNPKTFQEKLQWMKYYYHDPLYTKLVDKYAVREWVKEKIGEEYLVPLYGVYNSFDEIDFDALPESFVLKCTHDSGSIVLCRDKSKLDKAAAREKLEKGLARNQFYLSREWPYKNVPPRIICEKYLIDDNMADPPDYKFFCFDGKVKVFLINYERHSESGIKVNYYSSDLERLLVKEGDTPNYEKDIFPCKMEDMINSAEKLAYGMPHVRVDFNYVNEHIYFGEMTFYHAGGRRLLYEPEEYNYIFGDYIKLPPKRR